MSARIGPGSPRRWQYNADHEPDRSAGRVAGGGGGSAVPWAGWVA